MDQLKWEEVKETLRGLIPAHSFDLWVTPLRFVGAENGSITLSCPNNFSKARVAKKEILEPIQKALGGAKIILDVCRASNGETDNLAVREILSSAQLPLPLSARNGDECGLRKSSTFEQFIVGEDSSFAYAASIALALGNGGVKQPLFLVSGSGMGKSHLAQAIGNRILENDPTKQICCLVTDDFSVEMVRALRTDSIENFQARYRNCDILILEDVQFISGKKRTQVELAIIWDFLCKKGKRLVFTSDCLPKEIPKLEEVLQSRFSSAIIASIGIPDFKTRIKIIKLKAQSQGISISEEIAHFLAGELTDSIRQLEGGLAGIAARAVLLNKSIDLILAEAVVRDIASQKRITIEAIKKMVAIEFGVKPEELSFKRRHQRVVRPRQVAMFLSRRYTDLPLQSIGKSFGKGHATTMHAIAGIERGIKVNGQLRGQVELLSKKLERCEQ